MNEQKNKWTQCKSLRKRHSYFKSAFILLSPVPRLNFPPLCPHFCIITKSFSWWFSLCTFIHSFVNLFLISDQCSSRLPIMPKGVRVTDFSEAEKMRIAEKFRDTEHNLRSTKNYVRTVLDGNRNPNPRRDLRPCLNHSTLTKWVIKLDKGIAPHDDRRRWYYLS